MREIFYIFNLKNGRSLDIRINQIWDWCTTLSTHTHTHELRVDSWKYA